MLVQFQQFRACAGEFIPADIQWWTSWAILLERGTGGCGNLQSHYHSMILFLNGFCVLEQPSMGMQYGARIMSTTVDQYNHDIEWYFHHSDPDGRVCRTDPHVMQVDHDQATQQYLRSFLGSDVYLFI